MWKQLSQNLIAAHYEKRYLSKIRLFRNYYLDRVHRSPLKLSIVYKHISGF